MYMSDYRCSVYFEIQNFKNMYIFIYLHFIYDAVVSSTYVELNDRSINK
jgi:hypothetical protein